ncbi:MAG: DUF2236 domain-containing protein [Actinobacteria bacterium]|nr:DUF2236 domain-containing protein [Actinomycetota bacterium]
MPVIPPVLSPLRLVGCLAPRGVPLLGHAVRVGLHRVFGGPTFDPAAAPGDPGLFGPGSASWRVIADPAAIVGGLRALLLQLLHPLAMAGVADHSRFREDPLGRLQRTSAYVTVTTFGSTGEVLQAARAVRRVHRSVTGTAPDGRAYRADDPHLLGWVGVTMMSSFLATDRVYARHPVERSSADAFVAEQARAAALLDPRVDLDAVSARPDALRRGEIRLPMVDDGTLPTSVDALHNRFAAYRPELAVTDQSREALRFLLWPAFDPPVKAAYLPVLAGALATVAPAERRLLGVPMGRVVAAAAIAQTRATMTALRLAVGSSPAVRAARARATADAA